MHPIVRKLEIDVMQSTELNEAMDIAHKYGLPAIVVHPDIAVVCYSDADRLAKRRA